MKLASDYFVACGIYIYIYIMFLFCVLLRGLCRFSVGKIVYIYFLTVGMTHNCLFSMCFLFDIF